jgi:nucleoside-diphosphate-sugar epimerase
VHAVNPPGYRGWAQLVLPMLDNTIAAACGRRRDHRAAGHGLQLRPRCLPAAGEDAPQHPVTRKGAIRVEMERRLRSGQPQGARVLIVRAGDFFGPQAGNNWFSQGLVKPGRPVKAVSYPAGPAHGHQWSYLPDVARTMVELLARRDRLEPFARFHMAGHRDADGTQMSGAIRKVVARRTGAAPRVSAFPWWLLTLASPFVTTLREMREMRYLWQTPVRMDNAKLVAFARATSRTRRWKKRSRPRWKGLGCLPAAAEGPAGGPARA